MAYATGAPLVPLTFSDGFKYYGVGTTLAVSATVNLSVPQATHTESGETLVDGALIPAQDVTDFDVPRIDRKGWVTPSGSILSGWAYDVAVNITATGQPTLLWTATVRPGPNGATVTPGMGALAAGEGDMLHITEDTNVPGTALIGA